MNIFDYIKTYGNYSFSERKFNEIDNVIFSCLAYVEFYDIVSCDFSNKITIKEAGNKYFELYGKNASKKKMPAIKNGILVLKNIMNTKRYKDVLIHSYQYISNENVQFGVVSFDLYDDVVYISFEGTDHLMSGWLEDFMIAGYFPVDAQKYAIKYLNRYTFNRKKLIVGGHSKGGHLAIISSMYTNYFVRKRIIKIYSNDGLGLRKEELNSKKYQSIKDRVVKLIPDYSIIGHLLHSDSNYKIIKAKKNGLRAHNMNTWFIKDNKFERSTNSKFCKILETAIEKWSNKYDKETKVNFIKSIFDICKQNNIESLYDLKGNTRLLLKEVSSTNKISIEEKEMFKQLYIIIRDCRKNYQEEE